MSLGEDAVTVNDSLCHRVGEAYVRTILYNKWDDVDPTRLAQVRIRVDRKPENSHAQVFVWTKEGWQYVTAVPPEQFWYQMPGYTRGQTDHADRETLNLADDLLESVIESGI